MDTRDYLAATATHVLNGILALDPETEHRLEPLAGQALRVRLREPELTLDLRFSTDAIALEPAGDTTPEATLEARCADLIAVAADPDQARGRLRFEGDPTVAQAVQTFFRGVDVDWEEALANVLGDAPAHQLGQFLRGTSGAVREAGEGARAAVSEWLTEESGQLPPRAAVEAFIDAVDTLRNDAARLSARITRLERQQGRRR